VTTARRCVNETVALLAAAQAPRLRKAVRDASKAGFAYVSLHGTLAPIDLVACAGFVADWLTTRSRPGGPRRRACSRVTAG